jgi:catecholate siderophore receptor
MQTQSPASKNFTIKAVRRDPARGSLALAMASCVLMSAPALAAEKPEVIDIDGKRVERNPASMKFTRPLLDTAQTINVIPRELIEQRGATNLRDVLRNVSGISMQAGEGGAPAGDQMSIRGFSARTDIFVDNVRDFGGYTRDPFNLEQVEVVKGPSSEYNGRGSTGGSINLVSKAPRLQEAYSTSVAMGTSNYGRVTLDLNKALPGTTNTAARLNVLYHDQDTPGRDEATNKRVGVAPSLAFGIDTDTQVTLSLFHLQQNNTPDYGIPWVPATSVALADYRDQAPPVDFDNWYGLKARDFEDVTTTLGTVQLDQVINANMHLRNLTRWGMTDRDSMITAPRFLNDTSTLIRRSDEKYRDDENGILSNQTNFTWNINEGQNWENRILIGAEVNQESEKRFTQAMKGVDSPSTDLFEPNPNDPYLENYQRTGTFSEADSTTAAFYLSDSIRIDEHWMINGGLRYDKFDLEYTPAGGTLAERTDEMLSYRAGVVYKPVEEASIYLG